jgi:hypothetical protein
VCSGDHLEVLATAGNIPAEKHGSMAGHTDFEVDLAQNTSFYDPDGIFL